MAEPTDEELDSVAHMFNRFFTSGDGPAVLDVLDAKYRVQQIYKPGGIEGQRETDRRAAQKEVVDFIYFMLSRAQRGDPNA